MGDSDGRPKAACDPLDTQPISDLPGRTRSPTGPCLHALPLGVRVAESQVHRFTLRRENKTKQAFRVLRFPEKLQEDTVPLRHVLGLVFDTSVIFRSK